MTTTSSIPSDIFNLEFSEIFRKQNPNAFEKLKAELRRSPKLVELMNSAHEKGIHVFVGNSGMGSYLEGKRVYIDRDFLPQGADPLQAGTLGSLLAHELGHAVEPDGIPSSRLPNPREYGKAALTAEGVALLSEYKVATELNSKMYSSSAQNAPYDIQKKLGQRVQAGASDSELIQEGAQWSSEVIPSVTRTAYSKYYDQMFALHKSKVELSDGQLSQLEEHHVKIQYSDQGTWSVNAQLPNDPLVKQQYSSVKTEFDATGKLISGSIQGYLENGQSFSRNMGAPPALPDKEIKRSPGNRTPVSTPGLLQVSAPIPPGSGEKHRGGI